MKVSDFNYELPKELIAQHPYDKRDEARLMVLDKENKKIENKIFRNVIDYLNPGDCLVINNTKVIPARLYGKKDTGANVEFLLLKRIQKDTWEAMVRPGNKLKPGSKVSFGNGILKATVLEVLEGGNRKVEFEYDGIFNEILDQIAKSLADYLQIAKVIVPDPGHEEEFEKAGKHIEKAIKRIKNRTKLDKYFNLDYLEEHPEIINDLR